MTARPTRKLRATVGAGEVLLDSRGRAIDPDYVDGAAQSAVEYVRGRGRPSLSNTGESPLLRVRVSRDLEAAVRQAARASDQTVSSWIRRVLERAARPAR
jgi:hypothetical protein